MKEKGLAFIQKWLNDFKNFSAGQKAATIAAVLALVVGGLFFATHKSTPAYAPLYTNLSASDASAVIDKLNSAGTPYKLTNAGSEIQVPKDDVYSSRVTLAADGLPSNSQSGYNLLDKEGVTTSQFQQQVDLQVANQTELNNTIKAINGIENANVHLAIPQQDVFNDDSKKPTASVMLTTDGTTQLTNQQIRAIAYMVSSSVPGMSSSDVTITDQTGRLLAAAGDDSSLLGGGSSTLDDATSSYNTRVKNELQSLVDTYVGAGHATVVYDATLDPSKQTETSNNYVYSSGVPPVSVETSGESYNNGGGTSRSGVLGAGPTPTTAAGSTGAGSYAKNSSIVNNALGTVQKTVQTPPGALQKQSVAVMLDSSVPNVDTTKVQQLVAGAIGLNATRGDTLQVTALPFNTAQQTAQDKAAAAAAAAAAKQKQHDQLMSEVKQGAIAGVVLIAIGVYLLMRRRRRKAVPPAPEPYDQPWFGDAFLPVEPAAEFDESAMSDELAEAQARRRALVTLAEEQPDDVARVLSGWLNS